MEPLQKSFHKVFLCYITFVILVIIGVTENILGQNVKQQLFVDLTPAQKKALAEKYYSKSQPFMQGSEAERLYKDTAFMLYPNNADWLMKTSMWYKKCGDHIKAMQLLNKAVELDPLNCLGYRILSKLYYYRDYEGCIKDIDRLDSLTPNFTDQAWGENILYLKGLAWKQLKRYDIAIASFDNYTQEITRANGEEWVYGYAFVYRGICKQALKQYEEANKDFDKALKYYDKCTEAYYFKALIQLEHKEMAAAYKNLQAALTLIKEGNRHAEPFIEVFDQLYTEDIEETIKLNYPSLH